MSTFHFCIPALQPVTLLRPTSCVIQDYNETVYPAFGDSLSLVLWRIFLDLLVLQADRFGVMVSRPPVLLPTVHFLHLGGATDPKHGSLSQGGIFDCTIQILSLDGWYGGGEYADSEDTLELHTPPLEHLILSKVVRGLPNLRFPCISRLTCHGAWHYCVDS